MYWAALFCFLERGYWHCQLSHILPRERCETTTEWRYRQGSRRCATQMIKGKVERCCWVGWTSIWVRNFRVQQQNNSSIYIPSILLWSRWSAFYTQWVTAFPSLMDPTLNSGSVFPLVTTSRPPASVSADLISCSWSAGSMPFGPKGFPPMNLKPCGAPGRIFTGTCTSGRPFTLMRKSICDTELWSPALLDVLLFLEKDWQRDFENKPIADVEESRTAESTPNIWTSIKCRDWPSNS